MKLTLTFASILFLFVPLVSNAESVVRIGSAITVDSNQVVDGDYYVSVGPFGDTSMSGTIEGDMYAFGGSVTVNGTITEDLSILGGVSQVHASVTDDVRIVAGEAVIAEHVSGDLFVIAGTLKVLSTAEIGGNLFFFGGEAVVEGEIKGSVFGTASKIRINGPVGGNIDVKTYSELALGSKASVVGDISYNSDQVLVRAPEATIEGEVKQHKLAGPSEKEKSRNLLIPIFVTLFATLSLYLLFRNEVVNLAKSVDGHYSQTALVGLGIMILAPIASVLLMVTVLGLLVGLMSFAATILLLVAGYSLAGIVFGCILAKLFTKQNTVSLMWIVMGTIALQALSFVPILGPLLILFMLAVSVGLLTVNAYQKLLH